VAVVVTLTERDQVDNVEASFELRVVYMLNVNRLGPTERRPGRVPTSTYSLHLASTPVHVTQVGPRCNLLTCSGKTRKRNHHSRCERVHFRRFLVVVVTELTD